MGQILHGSATTTHAIRTAIQRSKAPLKELATATVSIEDRRQVAQTGLCPRCSDGSQGHRSTVLAPRRKQ